MFAFKTGFCSHYFQKQALRHLVQEQHVCLRLLLQSDYCHYLPVAKVEKYKSFPLISCAKLLWPEAMQY